MVGERKPRKLHRVTRGKVETALLECFCPGTATEKATTAATRAAAEAVPKTHAAIVDSAVMSYVWFCLWGELVKGSRTSAHCSLLFARRRRNFSEHSASSQFLPSCPGFFVRSVVLCLRLSSRATAGAPHSGGFNQSRSILKSRKSLNPARFGNIQSRVDPTKRFPRPRRPLPLQFDPSVQLLFIIVGIPLQEG